MNKPGLLAKLTSPIQVAGLLVREEKMLSATEYRVYFHSGAVILSRDLQCADDALALEQAERLFPEGIIEIWQGNRLVSRIENAATA